jgi:hypothetical protein
MLFSRNKKRRLFSTLHVFIGLLGPQSWQSGKIFLQSLELGLPQPLTHRRVCPPAFWFRGEGHTCWRERGWSVPIPTRGHTLWYSLYVHMYFVVGTKGRERNLSRQVGIELGIVCHMQLVRLKIHRFGQTNYVVTHSTVESPALIRHSTPRRGNATPLPGPCPSP